MGRHEHAGIGHRVTASGRIPKSAFANPDGRVRCPSLDCYGDLMLFPTGVVDVDGIPEFMAATVCPLCSVRFQLDEDVDDRSLYLRIAWLRANPDAVPNDDE